ncbi:MAG: hypothetical protein JXB23_05035 [Candidatus Aminicenantes bacterium]|nr:hypothetical protein [Candidatus Aminicenantes bacterium]
MTPLCGVWNYRICEYGSWPGPLTLLTPDDACELRMSKGISWLPGKGAAGNQADQKERTKRKNGESVESVRKHFFMSQLVPSQGSGFIAAFYLIDGNLFRKGFEQR